MMSTGWSSWAIRDPVPGEEALLDQYGDGRVRVVQGEEAVALTPRPRAGIG